MVEPDRVTDDLGGKRYPWLAESSRRHRPTLSAACQLDDAFSPANQCVGMALPGRLGAGMCERQRHHAVPA